jgi:hypothetical protein
MLASAARPAFHLPGDIETSAGRQGHGMRAVTVTPGQPGSVALTDMPEPPDEDGPVLVQTQAIGICGTDLEIINGEYGSAPPGQDRLIIGHESLPRGRRHQDHPDFRWPMTMSDEPAADRLPSVRLNAARVR